MLNNQKQRYLRPLVALGLACYLSTAPSAIAQDQTTKDQDVTFIYGQLSANWWQWALGIAIHKPPFSTNVNHPLVDLTGAQRGVHQSGPVWFLGGVFFEIGTGGSSTIVRNECAIPLGKSLFFPILNTECTSIEGPGNFCGATVAESRQTVRSVIDGAANLSADVDGVPISIFNRNRVRSLTKPAYCIALPPDDLLSFIGEGPGGYNSGTHFSPGVSCGTADDGHYVLVPPLGVGPHTVHFHGELPASNYQLDITYNLTVQ